MSGSRRVHFIMARCGVIFLSLLSVRTIAYAEPGPSTAPDLSKAFEQIDALAAAEWAKDRIGGITVGVVVGPQLLWTKSYGFADAEKKTSADRETVYRIGSITKQFTGLMLLQLVEAGRVHLADPVEKYFPEVNKIGNRYQHAPPITLVQLATMTAGISTEPLNLPKHLKGPVSEWQEALIEALPDTRYAFEPGTRFLYSNIGYAILGAALSRAADQPYPRYVQQRILIPLGMTHTAFEPNSVIEPKLAKGYSVRGSKVDAEVPQREHAGRGYKVPNGALYTTVDDLARFVAFELGEGPETVLKKDTLAANFRRVTATASDLKSGYGVGFAVAREGDWLFCGHNGAVAGYQADAIFNRPSKVGFIILRNVSGGKFDVHGLATKSLAILSAALRDNSH
jgi:CubicO group peptidase (beta-lactamase class C family)